MSGVMEAYFSDLHDPFFAVTEDGTASMLSDHFQDTINGDCSYEDIGLKKEQMYRGIL